MSNTFLLFFCVGWIFVILGIYLVRSAFAIRDPPIDSQSDTEDGTGHKAQGISELGWILTLVGVAILIYSRYV